MMVNRKIGLLTDNIFQKYSFSNIDKYLNYASKKGKMDKINQTQNWISGQITKILDSDIHTYKVWVHSAHCLCERWQISQKTVEPQTLMCISDCQTPKTPTIVNTLTTLYSSFQM